MTFGQRYGRKFHENVRKLECQSCIFVQNYRHLFLDEVLLYLLCDAFCNFSSFAVCTVEIEKQNGCQIVFFNGDQPAKVVSPGTCFLGPVQYDKRSFLGPVQYDRSFHGKHSKLLNMGKHSMFSAMQSERDHFLGI